MLYRQKFRKNAAGQLSLCGVFFTLSTLLWAALPVSATEIAFSDQDFLNSQWARFDLQGFRGGSSSATQIAAGGNPGAYRWVSTTVNSSSTTQRSNIISAHFFDEAVYDPSQGAIHSLDYAEDSLLLFGFGEGQATGATVLQDDLVYAALSPGLLANERRWTSQSAEHLTENDFTLVGSLSDGLFDGFGTGALSHPDFSESGSLLQFGYFRANTADLTSQGYTIIAGIDNWSVRLQIHEPMGPIDPMDPMDPTEIPEPASLLLLISGLLGGALPGKLQRRT